MVKYYVFFLFWWRPLTCSVFIKVAPCVAKILQDRHVQIQQGIVKRFDGLKVPLSIKFLVDIATAQNPHKILQTFENHFHNLHIRRRDLVKVSICVFNSGALFSQAHLQEKPESCPRQCHNIGVMLDSNVSDECIFIQLIEKCIHMAS